MNNQTPLACWQRELIPAEELKLPVTDMGVVQGVALTEMLRTFQGDPFCWREHWERFQQSSELTGIPIPADGVEGVIREMIDHNYSILPQGRELGIILSATPGPNRTYIGGEADPPPTFYAHTFELPGELWAKATENGQHLAISTVAHAPPAMLPPMAKTRSRLHWYLADREVARKYPGSRAILLDSYGFVRETSTANLFAYRDGTVLTAARENVLPGICRDLTIRFLGDLNVDFREAEMTVDDLLQAQEIFTTSTPYCLLGVSRLNSASAGLAFPGELTGRLLECWNEHVGLDIHEQLRQIAKQRISS